MDSRDSQERSDDWNEERLRRDAERIDELLAEIREMTGPPAFRRVEELVARLVGIYGAGLERILDHLGEAEALTPPLEARLLADDVVASLLLLHGLHPEPIGERVRRAVTGARSRLGAEADRVEVDILRADPEGVALRLRGADGAGPASAAAARAIRDAARDAAPEAARIDVEGGAPEGRDPSEQLVSIDLARSRRNRP